MCVLNITYILKLGFLTWTSAYLCMKETLQYGIPCNSIRSALRFCAGETITYDINHTIAGFKLSCEKWTCIVMRQNTNYREWVLYGFNGFQLVHSMCLEKHEIPPLGLAHDGCVLFVIWGFALWLCTRRKPWRQPRDCEVCPCWVYSPAHWFWFKFVDVFVTLGMYSSMYLMSCNPMFIPGCIYYFIESCSHARCSDREDLLCKQVMSSHSG